MRRLAQPKVTGTASNSLIWYTNEFAFFPESNTPPTQKKKLLNLQIGAFDNKSITFNRVFHPHVDCASTYFPLWAFNYDDGFVYFLITMGLCLAALIYVSITLYGLDIPGKFIFL